MSILVVAEHDNRKLKGSTFNTLAAASKLTGEVSLLVAGCGVDDVVSEAQTLNGISKVITCDNSIYKNFIQALLLCLSFYQSRAWNYHGLHVLSYFFAF